MKNNKNIMKVSLCVYIALFTTILIFSIVGLFNESRKYSSEFALISLFIVPITLWSFGKTLIDINCIPKFIKIKNEVADKSNDEKVDAYFDYLEEQGFSIFAPFVLLGTLIGSGFLYAHAISNFLEQDFTLKLGIQIGFYIVDILFVVCLTLLLIKHICSKNKKPFIIGIRILTIVGYITSIVLSFNSLHLLYILSCTTILGILYRSMFNILKNIKKSS